MKNNVFYKGSVKKDLKRIDHHQRFKIMDRIESDLSKNPTCGKRLTGEYSELYSLRVGDYRVIYNLIRDGILILKIQHRKESYR